MEAVPYLKRRKDFSEFYIGRSCSQQSKNALGNLRPVSSKSIGNWKNHLPRIKQQVRNHGSISDDLVFYGYEENFDWEKILDNVEVIDFKSHWPEYMSRAWVKKKILLSKILPYFVVYIHIVPLLKFNLFMEKKFFYMIKLLKICKHKLTAIC
jgi:hypothetical protein